jgi:hypothetical protein
MIARARCLTVIYRTVFYTLAATPVWGGAVTVAIVWHRTRL